MKEGLAPYYARARAQREPLAIMRRNRNLPAPGADQRVDALHALEKRHAGSRKHVIPAKHESSPTRFSRRSKARHSSTKSRGSAALKRTCRLLFVPRSAAGLFASHAIDLLAGEVRDPVSLNLSRMHWIPAFAGKAVHRGSESSRCRMSYSFAIGPASPRSHT